MQKNYNKVLVRMVLILSILSGAASLRAQLPVISYSPSSQSYTVGAAITTTTPTNTGNPVQASGQTATYAGTGTASSTGTTLATATFNQPLGATVDNQNNLYISEAASHIIRKITPGGLVSVFAGGLFSGYQDDDATGAVALFYHPVGLATDPAGNIYVADEDNNMIRKITPDGIVSTVAGQLTQGTANGPALSATFKFPCGVAVASTGNIYVADTYNNLIRKITPAGMVSTLAGSGTAGTADGSGTSATFNQPFSIVVDASENLFVTDRQGYKIRKITAGGGVSTLAGSTVGWADGTGTAAKFNAPTGLAIDNSGYLYVSDQNNNRIRKIQISTGLVSTVAGTGTAGAANGIGTATTFSGPFGLAINPSTGFLYTGDLNNSLIRSTASTAYTISPSLPAGLSFNPANGAISGTPATASPATVYTINAYNASGKSANALLTIGVITAGSLNLSQDQNYITTLTPLIPDITDNNAVTTASSDKNIMEVVVQYFDGLGRPMQTVQVKGSPLGKDIVQSTVYDAFGREAVKYLPYAALTAADGSYKPTAVSAQGSFYATPPSTSGVSAITIPSAQTVFEPSPLNRVVEQGAPGADWQPVPGNTSGHTSKIVYTTNNVITLSGTGADTAQSMIVAMYMATINPDQSRTLVLGNTSGAGYQAGQLYVTVTKDENWVSGRGGTTEEYKDKEGHVVLKRTFNYVPAQTTPVVAAAKLEILSTYYVYDDLGNLAFVLPPMSNPDIVIPIQSTLDNLCYQYRYDERNRLTQKKIPGKGWEFMIYNKLDQVVETQDANQRMKTPLQQASFIKYDALGRVVITGICNVPGATTAGTDYRAAMQAAVTGQTTLWETRLNVGTSGTTDYSSAVIPTTDFTPLVINYYDSYASIPAKPSYYVPASYSTMTKGLLTATRTAILNNPLLTQTMLTMHYYDDKGREVTTYAQHYKGGLYNTHNYDVVTNTYNFNDQVTTTTRKHYIHDAALSNASLELTVWNRYIYDHMGRKIKTWQQITNADGTNDLTPDTKTLLSQTDYNEIGQVWKKNLHNTTDSTQSTSFQQQVIYKYNNRGWLSSATAPLFATQLVYNESSTNKLYNGNIASQLWGIPGTLDKRYNYFYDQLNRITTGVSTAGNNERNISYDLNGNIKTLARYASSTAIDNLTYTYAANSNKLLSVNDATLNDLGLKHGTATYDYDDNGNMVSDDSKGITGLTGITYNLLNLPQSIPSLAITYTYDANGQKLRRVINVATPSVTEYIGGIQYEGTALNFIQTEEGRAIPDGATAYNYEYTLTDHLGNSRVSFDTKTGAARLVQTDDYYPFGMDIASGSRISPANNYLYNKKELQDKIALYDYGARFYDPVIARWTSVDPLAEKGRRWSPYNYGMDNPIRMTDPDGMWPTPVHHNLLDVAFGSKSAFAKIITAKQLVQLKNGSDNADGVLRGTMTYGLLGNQSDAAQFIHGMKPKDMTVEQAKKAADAWVSDHVATFVKTGNFEQLGEGLHTLMDETSPAHRDANGTPLVYEGITSDHGSKEDPDDIKENNGKNGYITTKEMNEKFKKAESDMQSALKNALQQRADYLKKEEEKKKKHN